MSAAALSSSDGSPQSLTFGPITRLDLALYCGASGDHNPIHVDIDFAKSIGLEDVVAHGMLAMAHLARLVTMLAPQQHLRTFEARFIEPVRIMDVLTCKAEATGVIEADGEMRTLFALSVDDRDGRRKLSGEASIAVLALVPAS